MLKAANIEKNAKLGEIEPESEAFQLEASPRVFFEIGIFKKFSLTHGQNIFMAVALTISNVSTYRNMGNSGVGWELNKMHDSGSSEDGGGDHLDYCHPCISG